MLTKELQHGQGSHESAAKQVKGAAKEATDKALGNRKLVAAGKSDKVKGKIQDAIGGLKDALRKWVDP